MSELTLCNHCKLKHIKRRAAEDDMKVFISPDSHGWKSVYVVPTNMKRLPKPGKVREKYLVSTMLEISHMCCC